MMMKSADLEFTFGSRTIHIDPRILLEKATGGTDEEDSAKPN